MKAALLDEAKKEGVTVMLESYDKLDAGGHDLAAGSPCTELVESTDTMDGFHAGFACGSFSMVRSKEGVALCATQQHGHAAEGSRQGHCVGGVGGEVYHHRSQSPGPSEDQARWGGGHAGEPSWSRSAASCPSLGAPGSYGEAPGAAGQLQQLHTHGLAQQVVEARKVGGPAAGH